MTDFTRENAAIQTAIRHDLLRNGYTPLPNIDKACRLRGWNTVQPTHELIDQWARKQVCQATGIRVENGLGVIDVDIDDADLVEEVWRRAYAKYAQLGEALIRYGKGHKEAWFVRVDEPFSAILSASYAAPGDDPEGEDVTAHRLEAFGGGHARQFGAFGAHTMREDREGFAVEYVWADDESPVDVPLASLPLLTKTAVLDIARIAGDVLEEAEGWSRVPRSRTGDVEASTSYDLTDDMIFNCLDGVPRHLGELRDYAETSRNPRCSASWMPDGRGLTNRTRCLIHVDHDGAVSVFETATFTRHFAMADADSARPLGDKMTDLGARLAAAGYEFDDENYGDAPARFRDKVAELVDQWAWCGSRSAQCLPIYGQEEQGMSLSNLRMTMIRHGYERVGPKGGTTKISPAEVWLNDPCREDVIGYRYMPDKPPGVYAVEGGRAINSFRSKVHPVIRDERVIARHTRLWNDLLDHLLPDAEERVWFMDWLAFKRQHPGTPGVAVLMVAAGVFGVGRGTLFDFIGGIFGQQHVVNISANALMGVGSQSQYTDWMANNLFVTVEEILPEGDEGAPATWRRKKAYEMIKERVDTKPRMIQVVRKTLPNYSDWTYASYLMATNHDNALPIPDGDRRVSVLTNRTLPIAQNPDLYARVNAVRNPEPDPEFLAVVDQLLTARDVSAFNPHVAPSFEGKARMLDANANELDDALDDVINTLPHDWVTRDAYLLRAERLVMARDLADTYPTWRRSATDRLASRWSYLGRLMVTPSRKAHVYARTAEAARDIRNRSMESREADLAVMERADAPASARLMALRSGLTVAK